MSKGSLFRAKIHYQTNAINVINVTGQWTQEIGS